jgi:hypothetical protein
MHQQELWASISKREEKSTPWDVLCVELIGPYTLINPSMGCKKYRTNILYIGPRQLWQSEKANYY